jgi:hypothetical protein
LGGKNTKAFGGENTTDFGGKNKQISAEKTQQLIAYRFPLILKGLVHEIRIPVLYVSYSFNDIIMLKLVTRKSMFGAGFSLFIRWFFRGYRITQIIIIITPEIV